MAGTTIGIYINEEEEDLIEEFDTACNTGTDTYSRSKSIKEAMRLMIMVEKTQATIGYEQDGHMLRSWVRQAMLDLARREAQDAE